MLTRMRCASPPVQAPRSSAAPNSLPTHTHTHTRRAHKVKAARYKLFPTKSHGCRILEPDLCCPTRPGFQSLPCSTCTLALWASYFTSLSLFSGLHKRAGTQPLYRTFMKTKTMSYVRDSVNTRCCLVRHCQNSRPLFLVFFITCHDDQHCFPS